MHSLNFVHFIYRAAWMLFAQLELFWCLKKLFYFESLSQIILIHLITIRYNLKMPRPTCSSICHSTVGVGPKIAPWVFIKWCLKKKQIQCLKFQHKKDYVIESSTTSKSEGTFAFSDMEVEAKFTISFHCRVIVVVLWFHKMTSSWLLLALCQEV